MLANLHASGQQKVQKDAIETAAKRLAELLKPGGSVEASGSGKPLPWRGTYWLDHPQAPSPVIQAMPPKLAPAQLQTIKSPHPPEDAPLLRQRSTAALPTAVKLPPGKLAWAPSRYVKDALPLPILGQPQSDRGTLADPTYQASLAAALAEVRIQRMSPVSFAPVNVPDPFEHAQAIRLRNVIEEDARPTFVIPRPPAR